MGKEVVDKKIKFVVKEKNDCVMYLGHLLEYAVKKKDVYWRLISESIDYYAYELDNSVLKLSGKITIQEILEIEEEKIANINISFNKYKLFTSAMSLVEYEITNLIGDFSKDKKAISYNNYLSIINGKKIENVNFKQNPKRDKMIREYNENRNYNAHFTSDKLCEWINFRVEQIQQYKEAKFEF